MSYKLKCKCGATAWVPGSYDPDTNATELNDKVAQEPCEACGGEGYARGFGIVFGA